MRKRKLKYYHLLFLLLVFLLLLLFFLQPSSSEFFAERRIPSPGDHNNQWEQPQRQIGGGGGGEDGIMSKIGSRPPSCEHRCGRCKPCAAIQIPAIIDDNTQIGLHYTNYEPESWKCICAASFYNP